MKTNKPKKRWPVLGGALCAALTGAVVWYDLACNSGRLVYPMDSYSFRPTDIPMILALVLGLTLFLSSYLLYRYDHDGAAELEDE